MPPYTEDSATERGFKSLCDPEKVDKTLIKLDHVYDIYPALFCHFVSRDKVVDDKTYVVLGTCGVPNVYGSACDYDLHVWKQYSTFWGKERGDRGKNFCGLVCLLDAECQSDKLSDAILFVPMIGEYFMFNNVYGEYPKEQEKIRNNMLSLFNNICLGQMLSGLKYDKLMLNEYSSFREKHGKAVVSEGQKTFLQREYIIAQVLSKYDMKKATDFEKQILVNLYDNAVTLLDNYVDFAASKRGVSAAELKLKSGSAAKVSKMIFRKKVSKVLKDSVPFTKMLEDTENMINQYDENQEKLQQEKDRQQQDEINKRAGKIKI